MMKANDTTLLAGFALSAALWAGCGLSLTACSRSTCGVQGVGTMIHLRAEGGFYGIDADTGAHYRPVNLPKAFAQEGLRVRFCAEPLEGVLSFHMWGIPVEIVEIEFLGADGKARKGASKESTAGPGNP